MFIEKYKLVFFGLLTVTIVAYKYDLVAYFDDSILSQKLHRLEISADPGLQVYVKGQQSIDRAPPWTPEKGDTWRDEMRTYITSRLDDIPFDNTDLPVGVRVLEHQLSTANVERYQLAFSSFDGTEIPAYLHIPMRSNLTKQDKLPAILVVPGHVDIHESGLEQTTRQADSYQHAAALRLAQAGFVTMTIELRGFGYLGKLQDMEHRLVAYNAILGGSSYKEIIMHDMAYAMAALRSNDKVDPERIGITGTSLGGELAVNYAALDESIKVIVFQGYGGKTGFKKSALGSRRSQPHYCHLLPGLDARVRMEEWIWLLAPRPTLSVRGNRERAVSEDAIERYKQGWPLKNDFEHIVAEGGHEYFVEPAEAFFKQFL